MPNRKEFEMSEDDLKALLESMRPVPAMMIGDVPPRTVQENANAAWKNLGVKMGFDFETARPVPNKGNRFFSAEETDKK